MESKTFERDGFDVILRQDVSIVLASLGGELEVQTLKGAKMVTVPAGAQYGDRLSLPGEGVPHIRGTGKGDFIIEFAVKVPKRLNKQQRELLLKFAESFDDSSHKKNGGFFQRIF
jgi:molecular chaperone DnaJ